MIRTKLFFVCAVSCFISLVAATLTEFGMCQPPESDAIAKSPPADLREPSNGH